MAADRTRACSRARRVRFYLGTHEVHWLGLTDVPLFISHRRLMKRKSLPRALGPWALDSGGFTELGMYGRWVTTGGEYVAAVRRYRDEIGNLEWAAPQDWMCEPMMLAKTGLDVDTHQRYTVNSVIQLRSLAPDLPFIPVLQGWTLEDYLRCVELYRTRGIELRDEPVVGIGSVCRRQAEDEIEEIVGTLAGMGLRLHGFGVKTRGFRYARFLVSSDSMAWSMDARRASPMPGHSHKNCANCIDWAMRWRDRAIAKIPC